MMEFVNAFTKLQFYPKKALEMATIVLSCFAPHLAEECWRYLGHLESIAYVPFPKVDIKYLQREHATYVIQINGKFRLKWSLPRNQTKESLIDAAKKDKRISKYLVNEIVKVIFVPEKLLNIVVKS